MHEMNSNAFQIFLPHSEQEIRQNKEMNTLSKDILQISSFVHKLASTAVSFYEKNVTTAEVLGAE